MLITDLWLITYEKDSGILIAPDLKAAKRLKRFMRLRGTITQILSPAGLDRIRVIADFSIIAKTEAELRVMRNTPLLPREL